MTAKQCSLQAHPCCWVLTMLSKGTGDPPDSFPADPTPNPPKEPQKVCRVLPYHLRFLVSKTVSSSLSIEVVSVGSSVLARSPYRLLCGFFNLKAGPGSLSDSLTTSP